MKPSQNQKQYRDPVAVARGMGGAHKGVHHWWVQRVSAVSLIPLIAWLLIGFGVHVHQGYDGIVMWVAKPWNAGLLMMTVLTMLYHNVLGLQVIVEDYVHRYTAKVILLVTIQWVALLLAFVSSVSVLAVMIEEM